MAGTWAALSLSSIWLALRGLRFPFTDDWAYMPFVTGEKALTLKWLWTPHNEHVAPLPKLIFLSVNSRLTGYDLRAAVLFDVAAISGLALAMILTARWQRGRTSYPDAFFPLALLQWGHGLLWWGFYVHFVSATVVAGLVLMVVVRQGADLTLRGASLAGLGVMLLPLCGANGVALAPALAVWLAHGGYRRWRRPGRDRVPTAIVAALSAFVTVALVAWYVANTKPVGGGRLLSGSVVDTLVFAGKWAFMGAWSELAARVSPSFASLLALMFLAATVLCLIVAWFHERKLRSHVLAFALFIAAFASLAVALGWGRAGRGWTPSADAHYGVLSVPLFCCAYFVWEAFASPPVARLLQMALLALVVALLPAKSIGGTAWAARRLAMQEAFERDLRAGDSPCALADRHLSLFWYPENPEHGRKVVVAGLRQLHRAGVAPFRSLRDDPNRCPL